MDSITDKPDFNIKGFVWCDVCKEYENIDDCVADLSGYCVCCSCNPPIKTGSKEDWSGRSI